MGGTGLVGNMEKMIRLRLRLSAIKGGKEAQPGLVTRLYSRKRRGGGCLLHLRMEMQ
jgi:hypothetical protein